VQVKSYDALQHLTQYTYDKNNRLLSTIDPLSHTTSQTYDNVGNIATKKDGKNNITTFTYDEFNRLTNVKNAKNENTGYTYDLNNNKLTQTDGLVNISTFEYNVANKVIRKIDHGGRTGTAPNYTYDSTKTESYTYYSDGSLETKTDRNGDTTTYTYDAHGRLVFQTVGAITISHTYDNNGNKLTITDGTGTTVRTYDELGRVLTKDVPNIGETTFAYDITTDMDTGCLAETSTDPKENITTKVYDKVGRLHSVTAEGKTTTYGYFDNGARQNVIYDDGSRADYTYYNDNMVQTLVNKKADATVINSYTYYYDAAHNMTSKVDGKGTTTYTYDALNRLLKAAEPDPKTTTYIYSAAGNRTSESVVVGANTTATTYVYNTQNRLTDTTIKLNTVTIETRAFAYDNNGNELTLTKTPYIGGVPQTPVVVSTNTYDKLNQLITTITGTTTVANAYNGDGLRVAKTVDGVLTRCLYEDDKVTLELDENGNQITRNVYGTNLLMRKMGSQTVYYIYNGHADVTALLDTNSGTILGTYYYDAFGNILEHTGTAESNITYAGYQYDKETGLYYLNSRMYDPKIARFIQEDTYLGDPNDPLSLNLYTYCHNEPLMYSDPTGHWEINDDSSLTFYAYCEKGDTLGGLAKIMYGNASLWKNLGYKGDPKKLEYSGKNRTKINVDRYIDANGSYYNKNRTAKGKATKNKNQGTNNAPIKVVSPIWQSSDENYSPAVQSLLLELNFNWYFAGNLSEQNEIVQKANNIRKNSSSGGGWLLDKSSKGVSAAADEFSWFLGGSPSKAERNNWLEMNQMFQSDMKITDDKTLAAGMFIAGMLMPGGEEGKLFSSGVKSWIKHETYNEVRDKLGKEGVEKFIKAMGKGIVGAEGEQGIKMLAGKGIEAGSQYYKYEIKVLGKGTSHYRILGNLDEETGHIVFDCFKNMR